MAASDLESEAIVTIRTAAIRECARLTDEVDQLRGELETNQAQRDELERELQAAKEELERLRNRKVVRAADGVAGFFRR